MCAKLFYAQYFTNHSLLHDKISSVARAFTERISPIDNPVRPLYLNCVICWPASGKGGTHEKEGANNLGLYYA